jgi:hypothetical protein
MDDLAAHAHGITKTVGVPERMAHLGDDDDGDVNWKLPSLESSHNLGQVYPVEIFHHEEGRTLDHAEVMNLDDSRMTELRGDSSFLFEELEKFGPCHECWLELLDDELLFKAEWADNFCFEDDCHPAFADALAELVRSKTRDIDLGTGFFNR